MHVPIAILCHGIYKAVLLVKEKGTPSLIAIGLATVFAVHPAIAAPVLMNSGFESPDISNISTLSGPMTHNWFFSTESRVVDSGFGDGVFAFQPFNVAPVDGQQFAMIDKGYIEQSVSGFVVGVPATLSYFVTASTFELVDPEEYRVLVNGGVVANLSTTTYNSFVSHSLDFTPATPTVTIRFEALDPLEDPLNPEDELPEDEPDLLLLDSIAIHQVPEPASLTLAAMAIASIASLATSIRRLQDRRHHGDAKRGNSTTN